MFSITASPVHLASRSLPADQTFFVLLFSFFLFLSRVRVVNSGDLIRFDHSDGGQGLILDQL